MSDYAEKSKEKSIAGVSQNFQKPKSEAPFQLVDNRPRAVVQRKMQEALYNSNRVHQLMDNGQPAAAPQPAQVVNAGAAVVAPQVAAAAVVPQQPVAAVVAPPAPVAAVAPQPAHVLNPNAVAFQPGGGAAAAAVAPAPVNPLQHLIPQIINLPPAQQPYQIARGWHPGFEVWAMAHQNLFPNGVVQHFNVQAPGGLMLHVYHNLNGQLEVVGLRQRPAGF
jgi:hypothetical protein